MLPEYTDTHTLFSKAPDKLFGVYKEGEGKVALVWADTTDNACTFIAATGWFQRKVLSAQAEDK